VSVELLQKLPHGLSTLDQSCFILHFNLQLLFYDIFEKTLLNSFHILNLMSLLLTFGHLGEMIFSISELVSDFAPSIFWSSLSSGRTLCLFCFIFGGTGVWTQGFMLAKQAFYCLCHNSVYFALVVILETGVSLFAQAGLRPWSSLSLSPKIARIVGMRRQHRLRELCKVHTWSLLLLNILPMAPTYSFVPHQILVKRLLVFLTLSRP
jgi:hypothetical protein